MADPIGIASGALALATFAFKSSVSLFQAIQSFQNNKREIRELREELEALNKAVESLKQLASEDETRFEGLRLPLLRCGRACTDFEQVIADCTKHSREAKTSFRDWAKLQYMGSDIAGFKNMLAGYKATISIAVADVNLYGSTGSLARWLPTRLTLSTGGRLRLLRRRSKSSRECLRTRRPTLKTSLKT